MDVHPKPSPGDTPPVQPAGEISGALKLVVETGLRLARERDLEAIVQAATDAGRVLSGAHVGAFFSSLPEAGRELQPLYALSGTAPGGPTVFPMPHFSQVLGHTFRGEGILRADDLTRHPRYGPGLPAGSSVRSYLAVPAVGAAGQIVGGMFYTHPEPGRFAQESESLVAAVAAHAAVAIDNARIHETLAREAAAAGAARQLQRETADRLAQVFEATTDAVHLLDREWRITYMNSRAVELVARGRYLIGQNIWEAFPEAVGSVFYHRYIDVMAGRGPVQFSEFYPPLGLWLTVKAYPTPEGIAIFFQDVTDDRRIAREVADSQRRLRQALDAAQLGTWGWDRETDMLDFDERGAQLFHVRPDEPVGRSDLRELMVVEEDRDLTTVNLNRAVETRGLYQAEYRVLGPDGVQTWVSASGIPTFAQDSTEVKGMVGTVQDITLRKVQEGALRESEKLAATGRLAATIAHEINNPLEAVTNLIYLCKTDPHIPSNVRHLLETADQELARVAQIAQQTLGFYRDTTRPVDIDLSDMLHGVVTLFHRKLTYKKITCTLDLAPGLHIFGLQGELRQVFSNLVVNAIDASLHGRITIRSRPRSVAGVAGVSVLVCDEGTGVAASVRHRLFSPFFTTKQSIGTGLGLWVTRGIVEKQGGTIRFRSSAMPPSGTIFRVFLPLHQPSQKIQPESPAAKFLQ